MSAIYRFSRHGAAFRHLAAVGLTASLFLGIALMTAPGAAAADPDLDALHNEEEVAIGTDPNKYDTDGDGLHDGFEVWVTFTNPLSMDTDGDGVSDGAEVTAGTNPLLVDFVAPAPGPGQVVDSDGDGLYDDDEGGVYGTNSAVVDTDGDGSGDGEEVYLGTDPLVANGAVERADSDGDGLFDLDETSVYGTDPNVADSDGDGASDGQEVFAGTDPLS